MKVLLPILVGLMLFIAGSAYAAGEIKHQDGEPVCWDDETQCTAVPPEQVSIICRHPVGCLMCVLSPDMRKSLCSRMVYAPGFCRCETDGAIGPNRHTGYPHPICKELQGSCLLLR